MSYILSILIGIILAVGFDALLHGLSHSGHGILEFIWQGEFNQRNTPTWGINGIQWHILADTLIGLFLGILIEFLQDVAVLSNSDQLIIGLLLGFLTPTYYLHIYAAYEVQKKSAFGLSLLTLIQTNFVVFLLFLF